MPIKIPKTFGRRKSSGTALEEVENSPAPSFRVFERPSAANGSWDRTNALKRPGQARIYGTTENEYEGELFPDNRNELRNRGSRGTNNSVSTAPYGSAASSARLSSSSTIPSSTDISNDSHTNSIASGKRPSPDLPAHAPRLRGWSLKNAGRTFSFANKQKDEVPPVPSYPVLPSQTITPDPAVVPKRRERAMTASTASTATPPKLLDGDLALGESDMDNFGNMFDSIGNQNNRVSASPNGFPQMSPSPLPNASTESIPSQQPSRVPRSLDIDRTRQGLPSPRSWTSHDSKDGLMGSPSPTQIQHPSNPTSPVRRKAVRSSQTMASSKVPSSPRPATESDIPTQNRSPLLKSPSPVEDEDARLLATSVVRRDTPPQQMTQLHAGPRLEPAKYNASKEESLDRINSSFTTATASRPSISLTALDQQSSSRQPSAGDGKASLADRNGNLQDGEGDRNKQAVMQREKQEAQLATHRQTMMKVVGESSRGPSSNTDQSGRLTSMSSPELSRLSHLTVGTGVSGHSGKSSGPDDDDEDVPLGILAAHGFPSRNKPPARLQTQLSNLNVSRGSLPMSAPPASVAGESRAGSRGTLPVFARNLPQDPYYGASPLNSAGRGQLSMAGSSLGGVPPGQVHPSGLVGVIAGEERARAMRRGSPNQQINDGLMPGQNPGMMARSQTMGAFPGPAMPGMMSPQYLSPGDQAQIQMAQQMTQMMQIQMQWMQQMAQMQHNGQLGQMPPMPMPNFVGMPGEMGNPIQRPFSMPVPEGPGQTGRAMSMAPGMGNQWNRKSTYAPSMTSGKAGYAPSIAPSERSTIGLASRYRPVSTIAESSKPPPNRASTFTSSTLLPWSEGDEQGRLSPSNTNITVRPPSSSGLGQKPTKADDEDDDQGWADMKRKRDKKKGMWKMKKSEK